MMISHLVRAVHCSSLTVPSAPPMTSRPSSSVLKSQSPTGPTFIVPTSPCPVSYPLQLTSPPRETVTTHFLFDLTSDEKVEMDDEVVVDVDAEGRLPLYHSSRPGTAGAALRNFEAPKRAGGMV